MATRVQVVGPTHHRRATGTPPRGTTGRWNATSGTWPKNCYTPESPPARTPAHPRSRSGTSTTTTIAHTAEPVDDHQPPDSARVSPTSGPHTASRRSARRCPGGSAPRRCTGRRTRRSTACGTRPSTSPRGPAGTCRPHGRGRAASRTGRASAGPCRSGARCGRAPSNAASRSPRRCWETGRRWSERRAGSPPVVVPPGHSPTAAVPGSPSSCCTVVPDNSPTSALVLDQVAVDSSQAPVAR